MVGSQDERKRVLLLVTVLIIAISGLAYELIAGTMATYLIGQSVTQFSFATGWFMAAMGFGSYLSRFTKVRLFSALIYVQVMLSIVGGFSAAIMFFAFAYTDTLYPFFLLLALVVGSGVGFEIPIILRILGKYRILSVAASDVFTYDYVGALFASLLFPLVLLPHLGLIRSSIFFGALNLAAAFIVFSLDTEKKKAHKVSLFTALILLASGFFGAETLTRWIEESLYQDPIVLAKETLYQRIVVTKWKDDLRLYLNGNLQFSTRDEYRYHEALVHIPVALLKEPPKTALILGAGDGMAIRELLKHDSLEKVTLIELDPQMIAMFKDHHYLKKVNSGSLSSPKVEIVLADAFQWLKESENKRKFDLIIADLPDPNSHSLGKLYTVSFYVNMFKHLEPNGVFITQSTSSTFAPEVFWCIRATIEHAGTKYFAADLKTLPYHVYLPSFGDWGFVIAGRNISIDDIKEPTVPLRYLNLDSIKSSFLFSKDILPVGEAPINTLNTQVLVNMYAKTYHRWYQ
jgi:spermidine synthase